ncbi:Eco29kI family restriction endonuclease [Streptomyces sp. S1]|uniref:Eco29kI family restriction endonuclease n=1 Tax=Streptomyces sp. S1 TaxID=718288 RepID=UPI003D75F07A
MSGATFTPRSSGFVHGVQCCTELNSTRSRGGCVAGDPLSKLGARITELRLASGWNVNELVARCSPLSRTTISNALNAGKGGKVPSANTVARICRAFGADSAPLLDLLRQAKEDRRTPLPGPRAEDRSRQFVREPEGATSEAVDAAGLFNPLRRENLERSVQWALESAPPVPLVPDLKVSADCLYALYYTGPHPLYRPVSSPACTAPVYVGKARLPGHLLGRPPLRWNIMNRKVMEHRKSLEYVQDLAVQDFRVRYLPVEEIWMSGAERLMIGDHRPVWNVIADGFGTHNPGAKRRGTPQTLWDELHPGRPWAMEQLRARLDRSEVVRAVQQHFARTAEV